MPAFQWPHHNLFLSEGEKKCPFLQGNGVVKQASREVQEDVIDLSTREQGEPGVRGQVKGVSQGGASGTRDKLW